MLSPGGTEVVGYVRVSTVEQAASGNGLAAQEAAIRDACDRRGWTLLRVAHDAGASAGTLDRAGLRGALDDVAAGRAGGLVVAKLDRLSRSVADFAALLAWFDDLGAALVALDLGIDSSTPAGRLVATVFSAVAEWEREVISVRTREALAAVRARGESISGPSVSDDSNLQKRIESLRDSGMTFREIADALNADGVPTLRGGTCWRASSLQRTLSGSRRRARAKPVALPAIPRQRRSATATGGAS